MAQNIWVLTRRDFDLDVNDERDEEGQLNILDVFETLEDANSVATTHAAQYPPKWSENEDNHKLSDTLTLRDADGCISFVCKARHVDGTYMPDGFIFCEIKVEKRTVVKAGEADRSGVANEGPEAQYPRTGLHNQHSRATKLQAAIQDKVGRKEDRSGPPSKKRKA